MKMNDNTILRIKVPAHLYESVKAQLTLKEGKNDYGMPGAKTIKEKKTSDGPKKTSAPKAKSTPKKANAPQKATGAMFDKETEKMGAGVSETKKMGIEELKKLAELLNNEITKLEEKSHDKEEKAPVEEEKEKMEEVKDKVEEKKEEMEESKWGREEYMDEPDYDEKRQRFVRYQPKKTFRPKYVPKGQATMTQGDVGYSSFTKPDADKN